MSTTWRVTATLLLFVLLVAILESSQLRRIRSLQQDVEALGAVDLEVARIALRIRRLVAGAEEFSLKYAVLRDAGYATRLTQLRTEIETEVERLATLEVSEAEREAVIELEAAWTPMKSALDSGEAVRVAESMQDELAALEAASRTATQQRIDLAARRAARARRDSLIWPAAGLLAAVVLAMLIGRGIGVPIARLADATRRVASGDFSVQVNAKGGGEVTDLARDFNIMTEKLRELDEMKDDFVSGVSHDLKAPLASMRETTGLVLDGTVGELNETQRELLELNLECHDRLRQMIGDLLDTVRIDANRGAIDRRPGDLRFVARAALEESRTLAADSTVPIEMHEPRRSLPVRCDRALLAQLLRNLLNNATRYSPPGCAVTVETGRVEDAAGAAELFERAPANLRFPAAYLVVADQGPGVADEEKEMIFERFYRSRRGTRRGPGSGLGLAIARAIAEAHQGRLWVEDARERGSRFVLVLPLEEPTSTVKATPGGSETQEGAVQLEAAAESSKP